MSETTFTVPDLTTFRGLDALRLIAAGQHLFPRQAVIGCCMPIRFDEDPLYGACGVQVTACETVVRRLTHVPMGCRSAWLVVRLRRLACASCRRLRRQDCST